MTDAVHGDADARFDKVAEALAEELSSARGRVTNVTARPGGRKTLTNRS